MKNAEAAPLCWADGDNNDNGMCTVNIELSAGDYVNVKVLNSGGACVQAHDSGMTGLSGFSGHLMKTL